MKSNSLIISTVLILAFMGGVFWMVQTKDDKKVDTDKDTTPESMVNESQVEEKTNKESDQYATFDVVYPQFKNASPEFNKKIESLVNTAITGHKKDAKENWQARLNTKMLGEEISEFPSADEKFLLLISWQPIQVNSKYISTLMVIEGYSGGAHGYRNLISFNYDATNKKEITLQSLFPSDSNYLKTLSDFSRKDLEKQFREKLEIKTAEDEQYFKNSLLPTLQEGTKPMESNFSVFTFTHDAVTSYFTQYQVGPYSMGEFQVEIPR